MLISSTALSSPVSTSKKVMSIAKLKVDSKLLARLICGKSLPSLASPLGGLEIVSLNLYSEMFVTTKEIPWGASGL
eukprot:snap_masked-scaffold_9-processed-gene-8.18-mRNA-1 protein AED:1.00 eAED:1.00 QI:0/0/0/0/1/1/2/0/75